MAVRKLMVDIVIGKNKYYIFIGGVGYNLSPKPLQHQHSHQAGIPSHIGLCLLVGHQTFTYCLFFGYKHEQSQTILVSNSS